MADVDSEWVGQADRAHAYEYQLVARAAPYLIKIGGTFVKVLVLDQSEPATAHKKPEQSKKPIPPTLPPDAEGIRAPGRTG